jgi:hypothetical protein
MRLFLIALLTACSSFGQNPVSQVTATPNQAVTWVTDTQHNQVRIYQGTSLTKTVTLPPDSLPTGVAVGSDGNARIALTGDNLVVTMDSSGNIDSSLDVPHPRGVTYDPSGNLWVAITTPPQSYAAELNGHGDIVRRVYTPTTGVPLGIWSIAVSQDAVFMEVTTGGPGAFVYECAVGASLACTRIVITPDISGISFRQNLYVGFAHFLRQYAPPYWKSVASRNYGTGAALYQLSVNAAGTLYIPVYGLGVFIEPQSGTANLFIPDTSAFGAAGD